MLKIRIVYCFRVECLCTLFDTEHYGELEMQIIMIEYFLSKIFD